MDHDELAALLEVDALTPGSDPIAPAPKLRRKPLLPCVSEVRDEYRLPDGRIVDRVWLALNIPNWRDL